MCQGQRQQKRTSKAMGVCILGLVALFCAVMWPAARTNATAAFAKARVLQASMPGLSLPTSPQAHPPAPGRACPVPGAWFKSSFGDPRRGHRHRGNDLFARAGTPVLAFEAGTVTKIVNREDGDAGGVRVWVTSDRGASFYAHNRRNLVRKGQQVGAGQTVAVVGSTGNADSSAPHLHFEYHPGGRGHGAVNPYPALRAVCKGKG